MQNETEFAWSDTYLLGFHPMDETHQEFVDRVRTMLEASDQEFLPALRSFTEHLERHFAQEKEWMVATDFPATDCHVDEHDAVLQSAHEVIALLSAESGKTEIGRSMAQELTRWFPAHADYLDSALAQWMAKRAYGGVPVVLRRNVISAEE
ncbi:hemerythrin domain-containing protein [Ferribacterium limneticum]|uniref:hemerythrin domain-containing protein n=1 Tax=Ferribacterium limneticum TaxID=76259 RepID=UPI001CF8CF15|nr:hemerythrin domain-containing protein [Ferribacterium limneticum]UCV23641.1 hemerythrin domain-containing protein [Ferribacterium limneticum]